MKKLWKMRKSREAVSPVIATILMVAITVVLAAVLYVMVMGFGGTGTQQPTGSFTTPAKLSSTQEKVPFGIITPDTKFVDCKYIIAKGALQDVWTCSAGSTLVAPGTVTLTGVSLAGVDLGTDGKISNGDSITVTLPASGATGDYTITLLYIPTNGVVCDKVFTW